MNSLTLKAIMVFLNYLQKGIEIDLLHCKKRISERVSEEHMDEVLNAFRDTAEWVRANHPRGDWFRYSRPSMYKVVGSGHVIKSVLTKDMVWRRINW